LIFPRKGLPCSFRKEVTLSPTGGPRPGAGRKKLPPEKRRRLVAVYLDPEQWTALCKLGGIDPEKEIPRGALTEPLRRAISAGLGALLAADMLKKPVGKG
jgi:hypothetical protein